MIVYDSVTEAPISIAATLSGFITAANGAALVKYLHTAGGSPTVSLPPERLVPQFRNNKL